MRKIKLLQFIVLLLVAGLIGYSFGINNVSLSWKNYKPSLSVVNKEAPAAQGSVDFSTFWNVWQRLETNYYDKTKLDPVKMLNGAIEGMVQSLGDPYTVYLAPKQNTDFKDGLAGQFSGIGAELGIKDKQIIVVAPLTGSPAEKAGIKAGDAILKVDKEATTDWTLPLAVDKIRGPKGTTVILSILHKDLEKPLDIKIVRDIITIKSVVGWVKPWKMEDVPPQRDPEVGGRRWKIDEACGNCSKVAYIRLSQFGDSTNNDWVAVVNDLNLKMQADKSMSIKGLILDLRNNPGGYLNDAKFIASEFLPKDEVVVYQVTDSQRTPLTVDRQGLFTKAIKIVVLINKGSASASEIVAGALRDHNRAILVGETSFGKGTIQEAQDLGNGAGIHITIAKWLTPKDIWVNGAGLKPDIEVKLDSEDLSYDTQLEKGVLEMLK